MLIKYDKVCFISRIPNLELLRLMKEINNKTKSVIVTTN